MEEIKHVVFGMAHKKSPGPDGFTAGFYQHFWDLVNNDLKTLFDDFRNGILDSVRLNYEIITLVPKTKDANQIQKFRPICLLNVSINVFSKVLMNKLNGVVGEVVSPIQITFIKKHIYYGEFF